MSDIQKFLAQYDIELSKDQEQKQARKTTGRFQYFGLNPNQSQDVAIVSVDTINNFVMAETTSEKLSKWENRKVTRINFVPPYDEGLTLTYTTLSEKTLPENVMQILQDNEDLKGSLEKDLTYYDGVNKFDRLTLESPLHVTVWREPLNSETNKNSWGRYYLK